LQNGILISFGVNNKDRGLIAKEDAGLGEVTVRSFQAGDAVHFRQMNEEWIRTLFAIEAKDTKMLSNPQGKIRDKGGEIFMAELEGRIVGCCALMKLAEDEYEACKMAVLPELRNQGIGRVLLSGVVEAARKMGARRVYLETSSKLKNAIRLYESLGFVAMGPEALTDSPYARADVAMEIWL